MLQTINQGDPVTLLCGISPSGFFKRGFDHFLGILLHTGPHPFVRSPRPGRLSRTPPHELFCSTLPSFNAVDGTLLRNSESVSATGILSGKGEADGKTMSVCGLISGEVMSGDRKSATKQDGQLVGPQATD
jgi:hypothetical protein